MSSTRRTSTTTVDRLRRWSRAAFGLLVLSGCFRHSHLDSARATNGEADSTPPSLEGLPLADRCRIGEMTAFWTYRSPDGQALEPIPDSNCAQSLAGAGDGRVWFRVALDRAKGDAPVATSLFRDGEACAWSKLRLLTKDWPQRPKSIVATVGVALDMTGVDHGKIPFIVGVEPRPRDDGGIQSSPCGANEGHLEFRDGHWAVHD
jgi:hypothetical protein